MCDKKHLKQKKTRKMSDGFTQGLEPACRVDADHKPAGGGHLRARRSPDKVHSHEKHKHSLTESEVVLIGPNRRAQRCNPAEELNQDANKLETSFCSGPGSTNSGVVPNLNQTGRPSL